MISELKVKNYFSIFMSNFINDNLKHTKILQNINKRILTAEDIDVIIDDQIGCSDLNGHLIISNHISIMDLGVVKKLIKCKAVSVLKECQKDSIIEYDLSSNSGKRVKEKIVENIKEGFNVLLFPQGEITVRKDNISFFQGGLKTAYENKIPILCVKLSYVDELGNDISSEHNILADFVVYIVGIPIEKPSIKLKTLLVVNPSDYPKYEDFFNFIYSIYL